MSMSSEGPEEIKRTFKADGTAGGDQGLLNLLTDDTVFYVGGYPSTFKVSAQTTVCFCCGDGSVMVKVGVFMHIQYASADAELCVQV